MGKVSIGKLSPEGSDFATENKGTETFKKNYVEDQLLLGKSPESLAQSFSPEEIVSKTVPVESGTSDPTHALDLAEVGSIIPKPTLTEYQTPGTPVPIQKDVVPEPISEEPLSVLPTDTYVTELASLVKRIGLKDKYTPDVIKANIADKKFVDDLITKLEEDPSTYDEAVNLKDTKRQRLRNEVFGFTGQDPNKATTEELEKQVEFQHAYENQTKQYLKNPKPSFATIVTQGKVIKGMEETFSKDPEHAFDYFKNNIQNNPEINDWYKGQVARSVYELINKTTPSSDADVYSPEFGNMVNDYVKQKEELIKFQEGNKNGFEAGQVVQANRFDDIERKMAPIVASMYKMASDVYDKIHLEKVGKTSDFGFSDTGIIDFANDPELKKTREEKVLARNAQIMLNDVKRLVNQFHNPNIIGGFTKSDEMARSLSNSTLEAFNTLGKFVPGELPVGIAQGLKHPLWDVDLLTSLTPVIEKEQKGQPLSEVEQLALAAYGTLTSATQNIPKTFAFELGEGIPNNLLFMAEMGLSSGAYAWASKGLEKLAEKELRAVVQSKVTSAIAKTLANATKKWVPELAGMVGGTLAVLPAQPELWNQFAIEKTGTVTLKNIDQLSLGVEGKNGLPEVDTSQALKTSTAKAAWEAGRHTFSDYFTEMTGPYIEMGLNSLGRTIGIKKIFGGKRFAWQRAVKLDSFFGENAEEWLGAGINWVTGDTNEQLAQQFTPRSLLMIAASVGVFTGPTEAAQQYKSWQYNKGMKTLGEEGVKTLGEEKWKEFQTGLDNNVTLNSRSTFVNNFVKDNPLDGRQVNFVGMYAGARTAGEIANGAIEARGKNIGLVTSKTLADLKLQNKLDRKAKLIDLVESNLKVEYETLLEKYKETVSNPNASNKQAKRDLRAEFKKLLTNPSIVSGVEAINKEFAQLVDNASIKSDVEQITAEYEQKMNALVTPKEMSDGQFAVDEMDAAARLQMNTAHQQERETIGDMRSGQIDTRFKELNGLVGTALSPEERIADIAEIISKNKESKLLKPKEIKGLLSLKTQLLSLSQEQFNELRHRRDFAKGQLARITKAEKTAEEAKQRKAMLAGFVDEAGNVRENINHSPVIEQAYLAEDALRQEMIKGVPTSESQKKYGEAMTKLRSTFLGSINDKKGVEISEVNNETIKEGTKVILQHNRLGDRRDPIEIAGTVKSVNSKNGTALVEVVAENGEKSEIVYNQNMGKSGNWTMFENNNKENNSVYRGREASTFERNGKFYFKNKAKFEEYQTARKGLNGKTKYFNSESEANNALTEFNNYWDTADLAYVYKPKDSKKWLVKTRKAEYANEELKAEIIAERKAKELNDWLIKNARPETDIASENLTDQQKSAIALGMQDEVDLNDYLEGVFNDARNRVFENDSRTETVQRVNTQIEKVKILKVLNRLSRGLGISFTVVETDPRYPDNPRAGWQIGNKYYVNLSVASLDTPIHEYVHPIMDTIETEFPELFKNLYKELEATNDPRLTKIIEDVNRLYPELTKQQKQKESIVTALGLTGEMQLNVDLSPFAQIIYRIGNYIKNKIQQLLGIGGVTVNTTMGELSQMILTGRVSIGKRAKSNVEQSQKINPESGFQGYKGGFENTGKGTPEGDGKDKAMREIADGGIFEVAHNRPSSTATSARQLNIMDQKGKTVVSGSFGDAPKVVMLARNRELKNQPLEEATKRSIQDRHGEESEFVVGDMPGVDSQFIDYLQEIGAKFTVYHIGNESRIKVDKTKVPVIEQQLVVPSKKIETKSGFLSIDKAMTVAFDEFYTLAEENPELTRYQIINKAVHAGSKEFMKSPMYLGLLDVSQRKMNVEVFENMMQKMLRKKKDVFDEDGKQATMDSYEGVAATAEDKMNQFRSPFSKALYSIAKKTELEKDIVEKNLVDMLEDPKFHVKKKSDFENLAFKYTDQNHINIANALNDVLTYEQYLSLQNFYKSVHFEEQYAIQITEEYNEDPNAPKVYRAIEEKQSVSVGSMELRNAFDDYINGLNSFDLQGILNEYNSIILYNENRYKGTNGYPQKNFTVTQEYIDRTKRLLKSLTGFDDKIIDAYLDNPRILDASVYYWENGKYNKVAYGSTLKSLIGKEVRYKNKFGEYKPIQLIPLLATLKSNVTNNDNRLSAKLIKDLMNSKKGGYSNIDVMLMSYSRSSGEIGMSGTDVEGNRFSTMALAHQLYNTSKQLGTLLKNAILKSYYTENPMKIQKFNGFFNSSTDKSFSGTKVDGENLHFALLFMFHTAGPKDYQHFLGQFSDKTTVYTGNVPKWDSEKYWDRALQINSNLQKDVDSMVKVIEKYSSELAFEKDDKDGMERLAKDFMVSFTANSNVLLPTFHGKKSDFLKEVKVIQNEISKELKQQLQTSHAFSGIAGFLSNFSPYKQNEYFEYDGIKYPSNEHFYQAMKFEDKNIRQQIALHSASGLKSFTRSLGPIRSNWDQIKDKVMMTGLKYKFSIERYKDLLLSTGNEELVESNNWGDRYWGKVNGVGENKLGTILMQIRTDLQKNNTIKKFDFADMVKRAQVVISPGFQVVPDIEGGIPSQLRYVIANDVVIKSLTGKDNERLDGLNFMSESFAKKAEVSLGEFFARTKEFGGIDMLKAVVTGVDDNRLLIKSNIVNIETLKGLYGPNDIHTKIADYMRNNHIDVLSFPSSAKKYNKSKTTTLFDKITGAFVDNTPTPIMINLSDFYVQQDLRHENSTSPYDLPNQLYSNIVTLDSFQDIIQQIASISDVNHNFVNQFFSGFKSQQSIQQYLLYNFDEEKDGPEFKTLLDAWAINDPQFRTKVISKLVNLVNRDVLELAVPRQSSIEIPDIEGRLLGLRHNEVGHVLLPEIGVNIPGLRYAIDTFNSAEDAYFWMDANDEKLTDLKDKETGKLQFWQVYQDPKTNLWVVPGEPVLSTRVPAGDLHSHTIARARYHINSTNSKSTALTMLDMESQIASGSDNDGDARYNWVLSSDQGYIITDESFKGRVNNILLTLMDEYQSEKNFEKITNPINTEAFDDMIGEIMTGYENPDGINENEMISLSAQSLSRNRNMTGYNLKGIMSNLTSSFSYLKAFNVESVVKDEYNVVKAAIENILNLCFDNAKDPKIEKLGINESTAAMFIYELITTKSIDDAKSRDATLLLTEERIRELAKKYSPYSKTKDPIFSKFLDLSIAESTNLKYDPKNSALKQLKDQYGKSETYKKFQESYYGGKSMEFLGKIRKIRDGLPNRLSDFMSLRNVMNEFVHGKQGKGQHFFYEENIYGNNINNKVFDPNYKVYDLVQNIFNLIPGIDTINHLEYLYGQVFIKKNALINDGRNKQRLQQKAEIQALISMADFAYLAKMRNKTYDEIEKSLNKAVVAYSGARSLLPEDRAKYDSELIRNGNLFFDMLTSSSTTTTNRETGEKTISSKIRVQPYFGTVKLTEQETETIRQAFAKLPFDVRMDLAFYTIVNYGTSTSLKAGGWFNLIDTNTRAQLSELEYTSPENAAMSLLLYSKMEKSVEEYGRGMDGQANDVDETGLQKKALLKSVYTIFKEDKAKDYTQIPEKITTPFKTLLQILKDGSDQASKITSGMAQYMNRLGIKTKEELISALEKIDQITGKMRYQFSSYDEGTNVAMQDPALFAYMFEHFKNIYPEIQVFNNVQDFLDYIYKTIGRRENVDLRAIGAAFANAVYLSPDKAQQSTFFHEVSHIYWDALSNSDPVKKRMRMLYGWNNTMTEKETDDIDEMIIQDIGVVGTDKALLRFNGTRLKLFLDYLKDFWNKVKSVFGSLDDKKQAEIYFTQRIIADQIWSGGLNQSQIALDNAMRYQLGSWGGSFWSKDILHFRDNDMPFSTPASVHSYLGEDLENKYEKAQNEIDNIVDQVKNNEIDFVEIKNDNPSISVGMDGVIYYETPDGRLTKIGKTDKVIEREKVVRDIMLSEERTSVRHAAIASMVQWAANKESLREFKMDDEVIPLEDLFIDPVSLFNQIRGIVENAILDNGFLSVEVGKVVYDDQSRHIAQMDIVGRINAQGDNVILKFVPTMKPFHNEPGGFTSEYTRENGRFRQNTPLDNVPNNLEQKIKSAMFQFAHMFNKMATQDATGQKVTRMIVVPLLMSEENMKLTGIQQEEQIDYPYTVQDDIFAQQLIQFIKEGKVHKYSMNAIYDPIELEKHFKGKTDNERKGIMAHMNGTYFLELFTARTGSNISAWTILTNAGAGFGGFIKSAITSYGFTVYDFVNRIGQNRSVTKGTNFTLSKLVKKLTNPDGTTRGSMNYGSPGWGKTFVSMFHKLFYDSDTIMKRNLLRTYLNPNLEQTKNLQVFSNSHPLSSKQSKEFFGVPLSEGYTFDQLLADYHTGMISQSLFAFKLSSMIHEYRFMAANEIPGIDSSRNQSKENLRIATSSMSGPAVDMIRLNTPYEDLMTSIESALTAGYHIFSSTLMQPKFKHLIDIKYDSVFLLRDNVKDKTGFRMMQYRTMSNERANPIAPSDQKWNEQRYALENEVFKDHESVNYTDKFATDDLFVEPFHSHKEKISSLKAMFAIGELQITKQSYLEKIHQSFDNSITNQDQDAAKKALSLTMEQYILDQWNEKRFTTDENGSIVMTHAMIEEIMRQKNLNGTPRTLLLLKSAGVSGEATEDEVVQMFVANIRKAEALWEEVGSIESFSKRFDVAIAKTMLEKQDMLNSLNELHDRINKLDAYNQQGLMELVNNQMVINKILLAVEEETRNGGTVRPNTQVLAKILQDPKFMWIPAKEWEKMTFLKLNIGWLFKPGGWVGRNFKLDRLIDRRHVLLQSMMLNGQITHDLITEESKNSTMDLNSKFAEMSDHDRKVIRYIYGEREGDVINSMFGRTAYISRDEAIDLRNKGELSQPGFDYLEILRQYFDFYDFKFHKQLQRYGNNTPMFVPDVMAQLEPLTFKDFVSQDSEFARLVKGNYGVDISGPEHRSFRKKLYKAMDVSSEDNFILTNDGIYKDYSGKSFAEIKRELFMPVNVVDVPGKDPRIILEENIHAIEEMREMVKASAVTKFEKKERQLHVSGAYNKGMILRTEMFHEANIMFLNSLISNYHVSSLAPFAQFVEDRYKNSPRKDKSGNEIGNYLSKYITKYIDEKIFKHTAEDMVQFRKIHRATGMFVSMNGLGLNLKGASGNFLAGQLQNFFIKPDVYWKGLKRNAYALATGNKEHSLSKAIKIMRNSNVGMVVDDVTFKRSEVYFEKAMRMSFYFTTVVEDINQGIMFLGSMTDEELSWYDNEGKPVDPNRKMNHYRTIQIENLLRRIHGDYGHNRPLYGADPYLMEIGRFKMGWYQTLLNDYWGGSATDVFHEEHRAIRQSLHNAINRFVIKRGSLMGLNAASIDKKRRMMENILSPVNIANMKFQLRDTFEEAVNAKYDGLDHRSALEMRTIKIDIPQKDGSVKTQYLTITDDDLLTNRTKMILELFQDSSVQKDYLNADRVDKENFSRLFKNVATSAILGTISMGAFFMIAGLRAGAGGDPEDKELTYDDYLKAFLYGWQHNGMLGWMFRGQSVAFKSLATDNEDPTSVPLKNYSQLSKASWDAINRLTIFQNATSQMFSDIVMPVNPIAMYKIAAQPSSSAVFGSTWSSLQALGYIGADVATLTYHHMDNQSIQRGYTTETGRAMFYLRNALPLRFMWNMTYNALYNVDYKGQFNPENKSALTPNGVMNIAGHTWDKIVGDVLVQHPNKRLFEESQIFIRTMQMTSSRFSLPLGLGYINEENLPEKAKQMEEIVRNWYYNYPEWQINQIKQNMTDARSLGSKQIQKDREKLHKYLKP